MLVEERAIGVEVGGDGLAGAVVHDGVTDDGKGGEAGAACGAGAPHVFQTMAHGGDTDMRQFLP